MFRKVFNFKTSLESCREWNLSARALHSYPKNGYMRAWKITDYKSEVELDSRFPIPLMEDKDDIIIRVHSCSVNPIDSMMKTGYGRNLLGVLRRVRRRSLSVSPFPLVLGRDCSGVVVDVGAQVEDFGIGDKVFCAVPAEENGTFAEYVRAKSSWTSLKPENLSHMEAASFPYVAATVWTALADFARCQPGDLEGSRTLVHGASGGIGTLAIQLLKAWGAEVSATCSEEARPLVRELGADHVIAHTSPDCWRLLEERGPFDLILDTVNSELSRASGQLLGFWRNCVFVSLVSPLLRDTDELGIPAGLCRSAAVFACSTSEFLSKGRLYTWAFFRPNGTALNEIRKLIEMEKIRPVVQKEFGFEKIPEALENIGVGMRGKTVIDLSTATTAAMS